LLPGYIHSGEINIFKRTLTPTRGSYSGEWGANVRTRDATGCNATSVDRFCDVDLATSSVHAIDTTLVMKSRAIVSGAARGGGGGHAP